MASVPQNSTAEDIEDEIIFQQTLLDTLDVGAETYLDERLHIEAVLQELQASLDALAGGSQGCMDGPANGFSAGGSQNSLVNVPAGMSSTFPASLFSLRFLHLSLLLI